MASDILSSRYVLDEHDKQILRTLAHRVAQHAAEPIWDLKRDLWRRHNDLETDEPVIFIDPENGWKEIITDADLQCTDPIARGWEFELRKRIYHAENLKDDFVVDDMFEVPFVSSDDGWGVPLRHKGGENGGAWIVIPAIEDYEEVFEKLHYPNITIDQKASEELLAMAHDTFDGILKVRRYQMWWWTLGLTQHYIMLRGLEDFLCDFILEPDWVHRMMEMLCSGTERMLDSLLAQNALFCNAGNHYVGSGGFGFTHDLPDMEGLPVSSTSQMWGFVESQETSSVSPETYGEFIAPYHLRIASHFGLNCYACCESFLPRWEYARKIPNLRRVSCSPWCDRAKAQEVLGNHYIASHKISPTPLANPHMDEAVVRRDLRVALDHAAGTIPELIMKDNNTLGHCPQNAVRWVELAREEIART